METKLSVSVMQNLLATYVGFLYQTWAIWKSRHRHLGISIGIDVGIGIGINFFLSCEVFIFAFRSFI